jgi:type IV pilus assembly protein PilX
MNKQRGTVLIMALMFLVVLSLLGMGMVSSTSVEEKMSRNARDQDVAMQAAEAALRDARIRITGYWTNPAAPVSGFDFVDACTNGLCSRNATQPVYAQLNSGVPYLDGAPSVQLGYGTTGSPALVGVAQPPRYLIERIVIQKPGDTVTGTAGGLIAHRITAKGFGRSSSTQVILQEVVIL